MAHFKTHRKVMWVRQLAIGVTILVAIMLLTRHSSAAEHAKGYIPTDGQVLVNGAAPVNPPPSQVIHLDAPPVLAAPERGAPSEQVAAPATAVRQQVDPLNVIPPVSDGCLRYLFFDKPVKTGSTAVTEALARYFERTDEPVWDCNDMDHCTTVAQNVCSGALSKAHLIQHVFLNDSLSDCLKGQGFYRLTSIREPKERVISAFKYTKSQKASHYGIPYNSTFEEFVGKFPKCALYHYYDGGTSYCETKQEVYERADRIVDMFDEVIDLSDEAISDMHQRIKPYLKEVNVAPNGASTSSEQHVPDEVVEMEYVLYNKLREKRIALTQQPKQVFCQR